MDKKHGFGVDIGGKRDELVENMEKEWILISRAIFRPPLVENPVETVENSAKTRVLKESWHTFFLKSTKSPPFASFFTAAQATLGRDFVALFCGLPIAFLFGLWYNVYDF